MKSAALRYTLVFALSHARLLRERLWARFWPAASLAAFFAALALFNLPLWLGAAAHLLFLGLCAAALMAAFLFLGAPFCWPTRAEVERGMEKASALRHRPLQALNDRPAEGLPPQALALWEKHRQQAAARLGRLRVSTPETQVAARDRWALRHLALLLLAVGLAVAQGDAPARLRQALAPDIGGLLGSRAVALDLWITPPDYTRQPALFLASASKGLLAQDAAVEVPEGSVLKLRLSGTRLTPRLRYGGESHALEAAAPGAFAFEMPLRQSGILSLGNWLERLGSWNIAVLPDTPPTISILRAEATPAAAVKITYQAGDDHGLAALRGKIGLAAKIPGIAGGITAFDLPAPGTPGENTAVQDLTAHPWAGLPVRLVLEATDNAGQAARSAPAALRLPQRRFRNPVAQRIIAERRSLLWGGNPLTRRIVAGNLYSLAAQLTPYKPDATTYLSLTVAARRLLAGGDGQTVDAVRALLWEIALRLEDGGLSLARRELRDALQKMSEALSDPSLSKQQVQELVDDAQKKMRQYVQALARELQQRLRQGKNTPTLPPDLAQKFMQNIDLGKMLEQMRQMSQMNSREGLRKMAENLRDAIDNLDMNKFDQMQKQQAQAMEALQDLNAIIKRQQELLDQTNKSGDPRSLPEQKQEQAAIRDKLGDSLRKLGEALDSIPGNFVTADRAMKASEEALGKGQRQESLPRQKEALDELQKGLDSTIQKMAQAMQQSILSLGLAPGEDGGGADRDPLGRPLGGVDRDSIKIPTEKERRRVQQIIEELRRRSNEPNRSKVERDYIDRLLNQF